MVRSSRVVLPAPGEHIRLKQKTLWRSNRARFSAAMRSLASRMFRTTGTFKLASSHSASMDSMVISRPARTSTSPPGTWGR